MVVGEDPPRFRDIVGPLAPREGLEAVHGITLGQLPFEEHQQFLPDQIRDGVDHTQGILVGIAVADAVAAAGFIKGSRTGPVEGGVALVLVPDIHHGVHHRRRCFAPVVGQALPPVLLQGGKVFSHRIRVGVIIPDLPSGGPGIADPDKKDRPLFRTGSQNETVLQDSAGITADGNRIATGSLLHRHRSPLIPVRTDKNLPVGIKTGHRQHRSHKPFILFTPGPAQGIVDNPVAVIAHPAGI